MFDVAGTGGVNPTFSADAAPAFDVQADPVLWLFAVFPARPQANSLTLGIFYILF